VRNDPAYSSSSSLTEKEGFVTLTAGHDDVEGDPAAAREQDGAKPGDVQVFHRQGNPRHPRTDGPRVQVSMVSLP